MAEHIDRWDGGDVVLITYADTIGEQGFPGLQALKTFVNRHLQPFAAALHHRSSDRRGFLAPEHWSR